MWCLVRCTVAATPGHATFLFQRQAEKWPGSDLPHQTALVVFDLVRTICQSPFCFPMRPLLSCSLSTLTSSCRSTLAHLLHISFSTDGYLKQKTTFDNITMTRWYTLASSFRPLAANVELHRLIYIHQPSLTLHQSFRHFSANPNFTLRNTLSSFFFFVALIVISRTAKCHHDFAQKNLNLESEMI